MASTAAGGRGIRSYRPPDLLVLATGAVLLVAALSFDWVHLLSIARFPTGELTNRWVQSDLAIVRALCGVIGCLVIIWVIALRAYPEVVAGWTNRLESTRSKAARSFLTVPLLLAVLISTKTGLQLGLYFIGYTAYAADDFSRSLSAAYWLQYHKIDLGSEGFLGLSGSGWLPLPDYLFGLGLALHRDLFLTPKVVNLAISGALVIAMYCLGRELFGRFVGLLTAALFAFQPSHVWLGLSGMTSDLPSVLLTVVFGLFLFRWLRSGETGPFLAAAAVLGIANGVRYENWFFSLVFSLLIVLRAAVQWKRELISRRSVVVAACALLMISVIPVAWMTASYLRFGDWLPFLHVASDYYNIPFATPSNTPRPMISLPLLAFGAFPFEVVLSMAGVASFLILDERKSLRWYIVAPLGALLVFAVVVKDQVPAYQECVRYFLPYIALLLPFAGFVVVGLVRARQRWHNEAVALASLIVVGVGFLNIGRAFNYPAMFPRDAIMAGRLIRGLQDTSAISPVGKVLIERAEDWGDLGVVALANRPERFVALNELASRPTFQQRGALNGSAAAPIHPEDVRGSVCRDDFQIESCKRGVLREGFTLVILSSQRRAESFERAFRPPSWTVGRYRIFDMTSLPGPDYPTRLGQKSDRTMSP
jgi:dolichyl-phosphate-mannose-protein mannosyltransferase